MRREDYERTYGRRGLHPPPPLSSSHSSRRSKRSSKRKMKCLISIGLILPALAAVIGVAAWAVSADVVMNSGNNGRMNKADSNHLLQGMSDDRNSRRNVLNGNQDLLRLEDLDSPDRPRNPDITTRRTTTPTTTTTTTTTRRPPTTTSSTTTAATPSSADVSALLSKLISASNAATGGNGPRFVVVAPLPDRAELVSKDDQKDQPPSTTIARADQQQQPTASSRYSSNWRPSRTHTDTKFDHDLMASESNTYQHQVQSPHRGTNLTNRVGASGSKSSGQRHSSEPSFFLDLSKNTPRRGGFNSQPAAMQAMEMPTFDSFAPPETLMSGPSAQMPVLPQVPGFAGPFAAKNRGPHHEFMGSSPGFMAPQRDQLIAAASNAMFSDSSFSAPQMFETAPGFGTGLSHGFGLKPIQQQQQQQHIVHDLSQPRPEESKRWGAVSFPPGGVGGYVPEVPKSISVSIGSPGGSGSHSDGSVIKSFFLPFLPKPKLNMNARVVFGVVLDKGMGFGGKKDAGHHPPPHMLG